MPARSRSNDLRLLIAAGIAIVVLAIFSFLLSGTDTAPRVAGSSYSAQPTGAKAAYLVLQELGHDVERSFEPIAAITDNPEATTLVLANPGQPPSSQDVRALRDFVERGGVVLAFGRSAGRFLPGVPNVPVPPGGDVRRFAAALPGALTRGAETLSARGGSSPPLDLSYAVVYGTESNPALVVARIGAGSAIWCLDETPVQNDGIAREHNVRVLANAAGSPGERRILWDEHYHGERRSLWSYVAGTPLAWGFAQLGIAALAMLVGVGRRRGPVRPRFAEPRTSPLEFVDTMGALYERAGAASAAIESVRARLRRRLAAAAGLPSSTRDEQLVDAAAARIGIDRQRTRSALAAAADALRRGASERQAVAIVSELQELTAAATAARAGQSRARRD